MFITPGLLASTLSSCPAQIAGDGVRTGPVRAVALEIFAFLTHNYRGNSVAEDFHVLSHRAKFKKS